MLGRKFNSQFLLLFNSDWCIETPDITFSPTQPTYTPNHSHCEHLSNIALKNNLPVVTLTLLP